MSPTAAKLKRISDAGEGLSTETIIYSVSHTGLMFSTSNTAHKIKYYQLSILMSMLFAYETFDVTDVQKPAALAIFYFI